MGVLRYFRYLLNTFGKSERSFYKAIKPETPFGVDILLIDCNAIFHPACREIFFPEYESVLIPKKPYEILEKLAFENVTKKLETLMKICPPKQLLYLAIDGVAGMCKQSQQRKRRYKAAKERKDNDVDSSVFDTNHISAGTPFMERLSAHIQNWIVKSKQYPYKHLQIIFDGMHVASEGEHKLVKYLYNPKNCHSKTTYCIYSPDADLLFLSMCIPRGRGYILRENIYKDIPAFYLLVNCYYLKQAIGQTIEWKGDYELNKAVKDYVLFLFLVGNDFLPSMYAFEINNDGINTLENAYKNTASNHSYLSDSSNNMCLPAFQALFTTLAESEPQLLLQKQLKILEMGERCKYPDSILRETVQPNSEGIQTIDFAKLRELYYTKKFGTFTDEFIEEVCKQYIRGLHFVLTYYTISIPSYDWFFTFHYAPLAVDISATINNLSLREWNALQEWEYKPPLTLKQSLLGVIPPSSSYVLPDDIQRILAKQETNPLFQETFEMDLEGKWQEYEAICLLPNITYAELKRLVKDKTEHQTAPLLYK
jgi:5'-3' exonuclease